MRTVVAALVLATGLFAVAPASAGNAPQPDLISPPEGSVLPVGSDVGKGLLQFGCPSFVVNNLGYGYQTYLVRVTRSPELEKTGRLSTANLVADMGAQLTSAPGSTNLGERTTCSAAFSPLVLAPGTPFVLSAGTYFWQVSRPGVLAGMEPGAVWTFTVQAPTSPADEPAKTYIACRRTATAQPSGSCPSGSKAGAFFESPVETTYKVCIRPPRSARTCSAPHAAQARKLYVDKIHTSKTGQYRVSWFFDGKRVLERLLVKAMTPARRR